jgi:glycosyltransferase involved in cell wall biosynthesis
MLEMLSASVRQLRLFLSVRMEGNRDWEPAWGPLDVTVQRNLSFHKTFRDVDTFQEQSTVHVPWDTVPQLAAFDPDVVISAEFGMRTVQAALYCWLYGKPLIVWATLSETTELGRGAVRHALRSMLLRYTTHVMVNGTSGARYISSFGFPDERIHLVPQASDNGLFEGPPTRTPAAVTRLLYTGQLIERKGLDRMHDALVRWCVAHPQRRVRWTIVGGGPLRATIQGWGRPGNFELESVGPLPFSAVAARYLAADIYVLPTLADEWGLVVNEAMIAGLPVLGSLYSQAVLDLVVDGISGWTFRPDIGGEVEAALDRALAASPGELDTMRRVAIARVRPLNQKSMSDQILSVIGASVQQSVRCGPPLP